MRRISYPDPLAPISSVSLAAANLPPSHDTALSPLPVRLSGAQQLDMFPSTSSKASRAPSDVRFFVIVLFFFEVHILVPKQTKPEIAVLVVNSSDAESFEKDTPMPNQNVVSDTGIKPALTRLPRFDSDYFGFCSSNSLAFLQCVVQKAGGT